MVCEIYLLRNGETEIDDVHRVCIGGENLFVELTENGMSQAKLLGFKLKSMRFDAIYSSPAKRARKTASFSITSNQIVTLDSSLLELSQGDWEGKLKDEIYKRADVVKGLKDDCWNFVPGDVIKGESQAMIAMRVKTWLEKIAKKFPEGRIAAFTHSYPIKYFLAEILDLDKTTAYKIPIGNASITAFKYEDGEFTLITQNNTSHLK